MAFERGSEEFNLFQDYWNLCKKFWLVKEDSDKWWDEVINEVEAFYKKYGKDKFVKDLCLALTAKLERQVKGAKDGKATPNT